MTRYLSACLHFSIFESKSAKIYLNWLLANVLQQKLSLRGRRKMTISPLRAAINGQRCISCAKNPIMRSQMLENLLQIDTCSFRAITRHVALKTEGRVNGGNKFCLAAE